MKTYCFVCKNYTGNSNLRVIKIIIKIKLLSVWK